MHFPAGAAGNRLRGALGKNLKAISEEAYARWFAPSSLAGPSGLHDRPRPFVLRAAHLEGAAIPAGGDFWLALNVFDPRAEPDLARAMAQFASLGSIRRENLQLSFEPDRATRVRLRFVTPAELKGGSAANFAVLWRRVRDRISTLRALYGAGPLPIDFRATAERAARIRNTRCELTGIAAERLSRSTGQRHSIGGFVGIAEYEGDLGEFVPYLQIAQHTGVGRQTVWGKGEIRVETF